MARTGKSAWGFNTPADARDAEPWIASGKLTSSTVIKAKAGLLGGVLVTATDNGGDINVVVWDSDTSDTTNDEQLARITIVDTTANAQNSFAAPSKEGVCAQNGIYVQVVAGDCEFIVYYK